MRLLRILLGVLLLLIVALPLAAWLVPPRLDLDQYRAGIAAAAAARLGRSVTIEGRIALRLLPEPTLTASGIAIGSGESVSITAQELRLRLALGPLLEGRIDARELVLRGADMRLPWPFDPAQVMVRTPYWLSALSARVEDGRLSVGGLSFTGIDATLETSGFAGSYAAAGTAQFSGHPWRFTAKLGQPGGDGSAGLDVALDGQGKVQGIGATLSGQITSDGTLTGRVSGRGPDLSHLIPAPSVSFSAQGRVSIAGGLAAADDLAMQIGGSPARGAVALRVSPQPRLDLALAASRLDLDAWLPVLAHTGALPMPVGIDLSAEAASVAGGLLRGLRAAVDLTSAGAEIREARAVLPGEAPLRLSGKVTQDGGATPHPHFEGDVAITAPTLRTTLAWLQQAGVAPFAGLPDGVLHSADLSAHVVAEPGQVAAGSIDGQVDGSKVTGSLTLRAGKRFAIGAGLAVDRLDLDPWLPASLPALPGLPARFAPFDLDIRLEVRQALWHGVTIAPLSLDAGAEGGRVTLRKLDMQVNGVHASGAVTVGEGGRVSEGRLDLQSPQAEPLAVLLPERLRFLAQRAPKLWQAQASVQVLGGGMPDSLGLKITADLGDVRLEAQPVLNLGHDTWTAAVQLRHPGAPRLAEALGWPGAGAWLGEGSLSVVAQLAAAGDRMAADSFELAAGGLRASGTLALEHQDTRPLLSGHIAAESLPLPLLNPRDADPLPLAALAGWDGAVGLTARQVNAGLTPLAEQVAATLSLNHGMARIDGLIARIAGGAVSAQLAFDTAATPPALQLRAGLADVTLSGPPPDWPLGLSAGRLDGGATLAAHGFAPATLLATLGGDVQMEVRNGVLTGFDLPDLAAPATDAAAREALLAGTTAFDRITASAQFTNGVAPALAASLSAPAGTVTLGGMLDLPGWLANLHLSLQPAGEDAPSYGLRVGGRFDAPHAEPELAGLTRWRAAHAATE